MDESSAHGTPVHPMHKDQVHALFEADIAACSHCYDIHALAKKHMYEARKAKERESYVGDGSENGELCARDCHADFGRGLGTLFDRERKVVGFVLGVSQP